MMKQITLRKDGSFFMNGPHLEVDVALCAYELCKLVNISTDCKRIYIEFNDRASSCGLKCRLQTESQRLRAENEVPNLIVERQAFYMTKATKHFIEHHFGHKVFYATIWY